MEELLQHGLVMGKSKEAALSYENFLKMLLKLLEEEASHKYIDKEKSE